MVQDHLHSKDMAKWKVELLKQPKLRFYRNFKTDYSTEEYVKCCYSKSGRSFIAQLHAGVLPL